MLSIIHKYQSLPFEYGVDCCTFVGECLEEMTGKNPMDKFSYDSERSAYRIIDSYGDLSDAITDTLGYGPYDSIKNGDICVIKSGDGRQVAGIVFRDRIIARVQSGLMDYPLDRALAVWEI